MANSTTGLFSTIVAASNLAASAPKFSNSMSDLIYTGHEPAVGSVGQTINIIIPTVNEADVTDIGAGEIAISDTAHSNVPLAITKKFSVTKKIESFHQARSERDLAELYISPMLESLNRKVNRSHTSLITSSNFTTNSVSGSGGKFTRANLTSAKQKLFDQGVPDDPENLYFITPSAPYYASLGDTSFNTWTNVGPEATAIAQQQGAFVPQLNAKLYADQTMPVLSGPSYPCLFAHRYAIAARYVIEESAENNYVEETWVYPSPNMPVKVQMWYSGEKQATILHLSCVLGNVVARENYGCLVVV